MTTSEMARSGSDGLFFKHQRKEEDYELRPEWVEELSMKCSPDGGTTKGTVAMLAGWELFEGMVLRGEFRDLEVDKWKGEGEKANANANEQEQAKERRGRRDKRAEP